MTPTPDPLLTSAAKRLDGAWPVDMDRLEWREALVSIEAEAIGLRAAAARDALALLAAARAADIILSATEAKALSAALVAAQPAPALDVDTLPELGRLTDYQRGYLHGFDAPVNVAARTSTPDPLREHEQALLALGRYMLNVEPAKADWSLVGTLAADVVNGLPAVRAALAQPAPALDFITWELAARFWIHYRCEMVGCETVEQHEHGGGQPMREMTPAERAALGGPA